MYRMIHTACFAGKRILWVFFPFLFLFCHHSLNANDNYPLGSRAAAMGNAAVAINDIWSVHHNQAGLGYLSALQAGFHHENKFLVPEFGLQALALAVPTRPGTIGFSYSYFGFSKYNESKLGLAFGRMFGNRLAAGIQVNYLYTYIAEDYGNAGNITVEGGLVAEPVSGLFIAAHVYNPTGTDIKTYYDEPVPTVFRIGLAGYLGERILAGLEAEKEMERRTVFKAGAEMGVIESLYLRAGIASDPFHSSFGLGYIFGGIIADIAFTRHQVLGFTPHFTISYIFR